LQHLISTGPIHTDAKGRSNSPIVASRSFYQTKHLTSERGEPIFWIIAIDSGSRQRRCRTPGARGELRRNEVQAEVPKRVTSQQLTLTGIRRKRKGETNDQYP
jgi:hypothetical protein